MASYPVFTQSIRDRLDTDRCCADPARVAIHMNERPAWSRRPPGGLPAAEAGPRFDESAYEPSLSASCRPAPRGPSAPPSRRRPIHRNPPEAAQLCI
jgi:hypothetical protein